MTYTGPALLSPSNRQTQTPRGIAIFYPFVNGVESIGGFHLGNLDAVDFDPKIETDIVKNMMGGIASPYARAATYAEMELNITGTEFSANNRALFTSGTFVAFSQTGATATAEPVSASAVLGGYYQLAHRNITALTDIKAASTALVANVPGTPGDYNVIDLNSGVIQLLQTPVTGALVTGAAITADYTYGTVALDSVSPLTTPFYEGRLRLIQNNAYGISRQIDVWYASFVAKKGGALISEKHATWEASALMYNDFQATGGAHGGTAVYPYLRDLNITPT
jgi:hypothetical protein